MPGIFLRQFTALCQKNGIVLSKHPFLNALRCAILPLAYGIFLAVAQSFLIKPNNYGIGTPAPISSLSDQFDGSLSLIWADGTNGTGSPSADDIMAHITQGFTSSQLNAVKKAVTPDEIPSFCPQNFNLFSECFAAVAFNYLPTAANDTNPIDYTIRADGGLFHIDVVRHTSDFEKKVLPLQWAVDKAIIELRTGSQIPTPLEWPFSQETNEEQSTDTRLSYIRGLRSLLVLALFICYIGIAYQLPGAFAGERANLLSSHLKAMGLLDSARIISWHISISLAYLPAWITVSIVWHFRIFSATNVGLIIVIHLLLGFSLASWSFFVAVPFGKSPQLAAVVSTFLAVLFAILALVFSHASTGAAFVFSIIFPPGFYIFVIRAICGFENHHIGTNILHGDPDDGIVVLPLIIAAIIDIFLWPYLAVLLERRLYDAREPSSHGRPWWCFGKRKSGVNSSNLTLPAGIAISIRNLEKTFSTAIFRRKSGLVTAVSDLSIDIPKSGIFVLLGSNGAGKSTVLSVLGNLVGRTNGSVTFEGGAPRPPRGTLGIVPQKNVLFPELTCYQTLRLWRAVKQFDNSSEDEDIEQLLRDCDLGKKIHSNANNLSGGQKRKLQLAIGLVGGSKIVLVDECTSGVDPLSRRALWRTLTSVRLERTIVFTTHFLDEADLLADKIAVLAAPGKLVAEGSPVALKSTLGQGYSIQVFFDESSEKEWRGPPTELIDRIRAIAPHASISSNSTHQASYHLKTKDSLIVEKVLQLLDDEKGAFHVASYDVLGTSIEDIFLGLMHQEEDSGDAEKNSLSSLAIVESEPLQLTDGRRMSPLSQASTIFYKRVLVARRSWLTPLLTVLIPVAGCCIPLVFMVGRPESCVTTFLNATSTPLYLPSSPLDTLKFNAEASIVTSPPNITKTLGMTATLLRITNVADNATFIQTIDQHYRNLSLGGISLNTQSGQSLIAWEATPPGINGPAMVNLATNILYNSALNTSGNGGSAPALIRATYEEFPPVDAGTLVALRWVAFFGASMAVFPAFFALYVSKERRSSVQAMQMSNGLSDPTGLWLGHLMFDSMFSVILATIVVIIWATASNQFHGLGFFWLILVLYGTVGALFAYCISILMTSPLASFAAVAAYQIIMFILYLAGYMLTLTYAKTSEAGQIITIIHFTVSILSPVASAMRAALVSVNLFSLLCDGSSPVTTSSMGTITTFGGPILYLFIYGLILLAILVWVDSGSIFPRRLSASRQQQQILSDLQDGQAPCSETKKDVAAEVKSVSVSNDLLRVLHITKSFGGNKVVDDVSLGVSRDTIFAMLGPNGAGKTTCFNIIRGDVVPEVGDALIKGVSVIHHPRVARVSLGVCPQFTAIDSQLTVREHLIIYGRLKGLRRDDLRDNVESLMRATALITFADRLASKLSGGNQRKLSLAIALLGNPSVILIDEFSTGIDAKMKRDMWGTLRNISVGKAVIITTHSMEEASALANKVGILAKQMLAIGTPDSLAAQHATYEVHFSCPTREDVTKAQQLMALIPGSKMADDVATRFEVPIENVSLAQLFHLLAQNGDFTEYTVERAALESVFLRVIRENNVLEEDSEPSRARRWRLW